MADFGFVRKETKAESIFQSKLSSHLDEATSAFDFPLSSAAPIFGPSVRSAMSTERHVLPVVFDVVAESLEKPFQDLFTAESDGVVRATPGGFVLSPQYAAKAEAIYNLPLRADDVWVVTFPKCGAMASSFLSTTRR